MVANVNASDAGLRYASPERPTEFAEIFPKSQGRLLLPGGLDRLYPFID